MLVASTLSLALLACGIEQNPNQFQAVDEGVALLTSKVHISSEDASSGNLSVSQHKPRRVVVGRLGKAGSGFAWSTVHAAVADAIQNPEQKFQSFHRKHHYIIGMHRNPYNLLLSLWGYYSTGCGAFFLQEDPALWNKLSMSRNSTYPGEDLEEDRDRFAQWIRHYSSEQIGMASMRFAAKYLIDGHGHVLTPKNLHGGYALEVNSKVKSFDKLTVADCWVATEHLEHGIVRCLQKYEQEGGEVNWPAFHKNVEEEYPEHVKDKLKKMDDRRDAMRHVRAFLDDKKLQKKAEEQGIKLKRMGDILKLVQSEDWARISPDNEELPQELLVESSIKQQGAPTGHASCEDMFADESLREFVAKGESTLLERFGYSGCAAK